MEDPKKIKEEMTSLAEVMNKLMQDGYKENFSVKNSKLHAPNGQEWEARDVKVVNFYRFEGESDPADNSILYALETHNGVRGLLSDAYGAYSNSEVTSFFNEIENVQKKTHDEAEKEKESKKPTLDEVEV